MSIKSPDSPGPIELSFVIPVFNGAVSIAAVVETIHRCFGDLTFEVVLVNDGSADESERVCVELSRRYPQTVTFLHLAKNFGEHSAVLAGLNYTLGNYVAVLDDDGQNPPEEVRRLYEAICKDGHDVVYGRYRVKQHSISRNLGSLINDRMANVMLKKPADLYLSSFKIMNRFTVGQVTSYAGAFPYIDGLILRATSNLGQVEVEHRERSSDQSGYTLRKLVRLWLNMFLNFSILPLRMASILGIVTSGLSVLSLLAIVIDKIYINPGVTVGLPTVLATIVLFAGVQLVILGTIGEYVGRLFLDHSRSPQFVVRYARNHQTRSD